MNKIKIVIKIAAIGVGIAAVIDRIRLHKKVVNLEERTYDIGRCHNDFCLLQERYNRSTDEQIESIQDEIGSVYEHIEKLVDMQEVKCKYADQCEELDCYYEEYAEKVERELKDKDKQEDGR
jgi:hypothetical protein